MFWDGSRGGSGAKEARFDVPITGVMFNREVYIKDNYLLNVTIY